MTTMFFAKICLHRGKTIMIVEELSTTITTFLSHHDPTEIPWHANWETWKCKDFTKEAPNRGAQLTHSIVLYTNPIFCQQQ